MPDVVPMMIASERGEVGLSEAVAALRDGASAVVAVEIALRACEANEADHYVGVGGLPNMYGVVELDASIMDGDSRAAGAVAAVKNFPHPITIARAVMEKLPQHLLLVAEGAERFADDMGIERGRTLTDEAERLWREGLSADGIAEAARLQGEGEAAYRRSAAETLGLLQAPAKHEWGTINIVARDRTGRLCTGVSTSGYPWKYPGRVGDSAIIGGGNYCDSRFAGAACTGRGELAIRATTARTVVAGVAAGLDPAEACVRALEETMRAQVRTLCLTGDGRHGGAATVHGSTYGLMTADHSEPQFLPRAVIAQATLTETRPQP